MLRKDYILRLTEEFGKFIGVLFRLKAQDKWEEFEELIHASASKYCSVELEFVEKMDNSIFIIDLTEKHQLKTENIKMLGDLLYEKGMFYINKEDDLNAQNCFRKSLNLFYFVRENSLESDFSLDMHYKIASIEKMFDLK